MQSHVLIGGVRSFRREGQPYPLCLFLSAKLLSGRAAGVFSSALGQGRSSLGAGSLLAAASWKQRQRSPGSRDAAGQPRLAGDGLDPVPVHHELPKTPSGNAEKGEIDLDKWAKREVSWSLELNQRWIRS